jgi:hypothetical protein
VSASLAATKVDEISNSSKAGQIRAIMMLKSPAGDRYIGR